jgi:hypothetical protein
MRLSQIPNSIFKRPIFERPIFKLPIFKLPRLGAEKKKAELLCRGACHRARIRATRWLLAMTAGYESMFPRRDAPELC